MAILAFFLGGWEIVLILAMVLIIFGAKCLPEIARGLDDEAHDAGRSIGGIHGKPAAEALTPDNQVAEFYDTDALRHENYPHWWRRFILRFVRSLRRLLRI